MLATCDVLERLGWQPVLVPFFENGKGLERRSRRSVGGEQFAQRVGFRFGAALDE